MNIREPLEIKDKDALVSDLSKLDFIILEKLPDNKTYIIKKMMTGRLARLRKMFSVNQLAQILEEGTTGRFFVCNADFELSGIFKLDTWEEIKQVMEILERNAKCP
jgi:hypothetical protein